MHGTIKETVGTVTAKRNLEIKGSGEVPAENFQGEIGYSGHSEENRAHDRKYPEPQPTEENLKSNYGEGVSTMGDKGGKKGKDKSQKQSDKKQKQKDKDKVDKQPKSKLLP